MFFLVLLTGCTILPWQTKCHGWTVKLASLCVSTGLLNPSIAAKAGGRKRAAQEKLGVKLMAEVRLSPFDR
jgi:hypothetical protein